LSGDFRAFKRLRQNAGFVIGRPAVLVRALVGTAWTLLGRPRLRTLDIDLTYACPCRCAQCYSDALRDPQGEPLTVSEIAGLVDQAKRIGAIQVALSGGEPLLRKDLLDVVAACRPRQMLVTLCTSGHGATPGLLRDLRRAGLGLVIFSLDSADSEVHDRNRGVGPLFDRVLGLIAASRQVGLRAAVNTVADREKLLGDGLTRMIALAERHRFVLNLTVPAPIGRWTGNVSALLDDEARRRFAAALRHPRVRSDIHSAYLRSGCPAGTEKISVSAYGEVRPCQILPIPFGSVRRQPLSEIWGRLRADPALGRRSPFCLGGDPAFLDAHAHRFVQPRLSRESYRAQ